MLLHKVGTQFAARGHSGANRVFDYGPGADSATVAAEFGFADLLDVINPLQHVPLLGSVYRQITGDRISAPARVLGDVLYGGPVGLAFGAADMLFAEIAGQSPGDALVAALFGGAEAPDAAAALAATPADPPGNRRTGAEPTARAPGRAELVSGAPALQALLADMRSHGRTAAPPEDAPPMAREPQGRTFKIRPRDRRPAAPPTPAPSRLAAPHRAPAPSDPAAAAVLQPSFAQRMMVALDKYEALARTRRGDETRSGALLDRGL